MPLPPNDAEVERLVLRSRLIGATRDALSTIERVAARSAAWRIAAAPWPARSVARVLVIASVVHATAVTIVPAPSAPLGRYLLAGIGLAAAALVAAASRGGEDHVRHLR
jgi:hypothetical protein